MRGTIVRTLMRTGVALLLTVLAVPASAQINPRTLLFELIDQLQTGRNRPVLYGPDIQRTIAEQTNDTGIYQGLRRLGAVTGIRLDRTQPLQGGTLYYLTATHQNGPSTWELGYSSRTERIEAFRFTAGTGATPPPSIPPPIVPPPPTTSGKKPLAPPRGTTPTPQPQPPVIPTVTPTPAPTTPPTRPPTTDTSEACRKFPNLC
jgi:hypothetical protein